MIYVLMINTETLAKLEEKEQCIKLRFKDLDIDNTKDWLNFYINNIKDVMVLKNKAKLIMCYNEEKRNLSIIEEKVFNNIEKILDYKTITIDDFSVVNH